MCARRCAVGNALTFRQYHRDRRDRVNGPIEFRAHRGARPAFLYEVSMMTTVRIERRAFLQYLGLTASAALLSACTGTVQAPGQKPAAPAESKPAETKPAAAGAPR